MLIGVLALQGAVSEHCSVLTSLKIDNKEIRNLREIKEVDGFSREYMTYQAMASLNYSRDINDGSAKKEKDYYERIENAMFKIIDDELEGNNPYNRKEDINSRRFIYADNSCIATCHQILSHHILM